MKWLGISPLSCFKGFNYTILTRLLWDFYESKRFCRKLVHHPPTWWRCQDFLRVSKARRVTHQLVVPGICWEKNPPQNSSRKSSKHLGKITFQHHFWQHLKRRLGDVPVPDPQLFRENWSLAGRWRAAAWRGSSYLLLLEESKWKETDNKWKYNEFQQTCICYPRFSIKWHLSIACLTLVSLFVHMF